MSFNKSPLAFDDVREILDKALASPRGIMIPCSTRGAAVALRVRLNYYRKMDRTQSRETYTRDHPMHGRSAYDKLVLRIPAKDTKDEKILFIEQRTAENFEIVEIPDDRPSQGDSND